jgi:hypothetical protein
MMPALGVDLEGASTRTDPTSLAQIRELVDAAPARVWTVRGGGTVQTRHLRTLAVHGTERVTSGRLTLDAGLRVEHVSAAADAATAGIDWTSWLPRALAGWQLTTRPRVDLVASYRRAAYQLPLNVLAIGDPAAPFADVSRWNGATVGPLIARVGPGTGGDPTIARIDPQLERPLTDELVLAVRSRPFRGWEFELARVTKREQSLLAFADVGLDPRSYTSFQVPDPSVLPGTPPTPVSQPFVTVYNRPADAYGLDRYVLTNRTDDPARSWALELNVRATTERLTFVGATALTWAKGPAAAVGFLPTENDQDVVGNLFVDRNSMTGERGQLFQDRSHVGKFAVVYRFPASVAVGAIARYQDGQPFARVVVVPNLTQGPTAVRAYANGGTAFSYIATLDVRLQKTIASRYGAWTVGVDVYNLPDLHNEVSEYVVSGAAFRTPTALQPPRTVVVGLRWTF